MYHFFDYSRRLHGQIKAMALREREAIADLHSDNNGKEAQKHLAKGRKKPVAIVGVNFRAIDDTFDESKAIPGKQTTAQGAKSGSAAPG